MRSKTSRYAAVGIIGLAVILVINTFFSREKREDLPQAQNNTSLHKLASIGSDDHVYGNRDAQVKIIEFSVLECASCKRFHPVLQQVMETYGPRGEVAWVFRHFPLLHKRPKSLIEAQAAECAAEQKGEDMFWRFVERFYEITPSNNDTDLEVVLPAMSEEFGLNAPAFFDCIESEKYRSRVLSDLEEARAAGGMWRPWTIIVSDNAVYEVSGAQPYELVEQLIEFALQDTSSP